MEPRELERRLKRKEIAPVLFLWGEESLLIDEAIQQIEARLLEPTTRDFNRDVFYGDEAEAPAIVSAAQTVPWLASHRLVLVRRAEALARAADAVLTAYCQRPSPSTCLIFTATKADASRPLFASLLKLPWAVRFRRLLPRELAAWVEQRALARGCRLTPEAGAGLIEAVGSDLRALASEIDKLVSYVGPGQTIDAGSVAALTADVREASAFELARLLSAGDLAGALRIWRKFASSGEYPGLALGAISHHVRQLWRLKLAQQAGTPPERLAAELGLPPFSLPRLRALAAALETTQLRRWHDLLCEADRALKGSGLAPQAVFEGLILRLCGQQGRTHEPR
jgi:DNA polymerase-3 subunit delta